MDCLNSDCRTEKTTAIHEPVYPFQIQATLPLDGTIDDLDDLLEQWHAEDPPSLQGLPDLHPDLPERLLTPGSTTELSCIEVYTDGSFDGSNKATSHWATWAMMVCGKSTDTAPIHLLDWYGDFVIDDALDTQWVGATQQHIREAEATALLWTALYLLAHHPHLPVVVYSDALAVLNTAKGRWSAKPEERISTRLRAVFQILERSKSRALLTCRHVKSHTGVLGNELADAVANAIRTEDLRPKPPPRHYAKWLQGDQPKVFRACLLLDEVIRDELPRTKGDQWTYGPPCFPSSPTTWLAEETTSTPPTPQRIKIATYNANTLKHIGAIALLRQQCRAEGLHVVGIQETRTTDTTTYDTDYIRYVGVAEQGHGGVELWITSTAPITTHDGENNLFRRTDATVLHSEPELLLVAANLGGVRTLCVVGHAPHRGHDKETITTWWRTLKTHLQRHRQQRRIILLLDANAGLYALEPHCGDVYGQEKDTAGQEFMQLLIDFDLFAPATFADIHRGPSTTWHSAKTTNEGNRNDYVILSRELHPQCIVSEISYALDAGNQAIDHIAATVTLNWSATKHRKPRPKVTWDRNKIKNATEDIWDDFFKDWPIIPWQTDVTTHMAIVETHLHQKLANYFPIDAKHKRNSCLNDIALQTLREKQQLKKLLCMSKGQCDRHLLHQALRCWHNYTPYHIDLNIMLCALQTTWRWYRFRTLSQRLKQHVLQARADWLQQQLDPLSHADKKTAISILKPMRLGKRVKDLGKRPLQQVRLPDDSLATSPEEACHRWRCHFSELEGGHEITAAQLWEDAQSRAKRLPAPPNSINELPSLLEIERQFQQAAAGKGLGCDLLPGELIRGAAPWMASAMMPLVVKAALWADEPLQHKGGRLIVAYKNKGDHTLCDNHRGLLVSSSLGKALHNVWRARTQPYVFAGATDMQFTAQPKALVTQAAHCVRMFLRGNTSKHRSCYAMFIDIQAAYYKLLRQHSIKSDFTDESIISFLRRMGIDDITVPELAKILEGPTALDELNCPEHLHRVVSSLHQSTWWRLDFDRHLIQTEKGTRPGDGFADVIWQLCFSRFLHRIDDCLQALGVQCQLPWNEVPGFGTTNGHRYLPMGTVVWADDAAILGSTDRPEAAVPQLQVTAEVVLMELRKMGMQPNMGPGKTEAILHIAGQGSRKIRQFVHHHCKSKLALRTSEHEEQHLRIIPKYIHLGGAITHDGSMRLEIRRKLAVANSTLDNYRTKVLNNPKISLTVRVQVYKATVALALGYNLGTWPHLNKQEMKMWTGGVFRLYKRLILRIFTKEEQFHMREDRLLALLQLPHPEELLHTARLRHFAMCARRHNQQFWALAGMEEEWLQEVRAGARWMHMQIEGLTTLPSPCDEGGLQEWEEMMKEKERKFNGLLKRAQYHAVLQRAIHADVHHFHTRILDILRLDGLTCTMRRTPPQEGRTAHRCIVCNTEWKSFNAWAVHSFKSHQRLSIYRQLQDGTRCEACGKTFANNAKLTRHFRSSALCAQSVAAQQHWPAPQPGIGSRSVTDTWAHDSMIPCIETNGPTVPTRAGWAMTSATMEALKILTRVDWNHTTANIMEQLEQDLQVLPIHHSEFEELITAQMAYHEDEPTAVNALRDFDLRFQSHFGTQPILEDGSDRPQPEHLHDLDSLRFQQGLPPIRKNPRFHYILHLFAGAKRQGDLHSCFADLPCGNGAMYFPVSLDVILDPVKGDLLSENIQAYWLERAVAGLVFAVIAGPPCETWSVSRLRQLEGDNGPRPLRSTINLHTLIWSLFPLAIRELRQTTVGNKLLQFSLLMMAAQCVARNVGLLEHPAPPSTRSGCIPPSIWRLPITQLMRRHCCVELTQIKQGYYGGIAPKPTTLMVVGPPEVRGAMLEKLHSGKTTEVLPPPLVMKRTDKGFSTLPLKRYPVGFCKAIATMLHQGVSAAPNLTTENDDLYETAEHFREAYERTELGGEDGQDYHG